MLKCCRRKGGYKALYVTVHIHICMGGPPQHTQSYTYTYILVREKVQGAIGERVGGWVKSFTVGYKNVCTF